MEIIRDLELQDEGSWALMIEEYNAKAIKNYHGKMAELDIEYYLSIGANRWYKAYFCEKDIVDNRKKMIKFLLDDNKYHKCVDEIYNLLEIMKNIKKQYNTIDLIEKFDLYCCVLQKYIAYYNSIIADTFFNDIYDLVDNIIPDELHFASNHIKDSLFATNNNELLSHLQTVDLIDIADKHLRGESIQEDVAKYVKKYKSTTVSSGNPNGISDEDVLKLVSIYTLERVATDRGFIDNLNFRYRNSEEWSEMTASAIGIDEKMIKLVRRTSKLSYIKILMRESFQQFKIDTRMNFLNELVQKIGKNQFDYMLSGEIADFINSGIRVSQYILNKRKNKIIFEVKGNELKIMNELPGYLNIEPDFGKEELKGNVLVGRGCEQYRVIRIEQDEEGLKRFNEFLNENTNKGNIAVVTNVLRPFLVPQLRNFGALITQYGGYTSHASVLCRELGINSIISVNGLMNSLKNEDCIDVDFDKGVIRKVEENSNEIESEENLFIDLSDNARRKKESVGNKALNLIRINSIVQIPKGFVLSRNVIEKIDDVKIQNELIKKINYLNADKLAIRSSHEGEDMSRGSCAGLFESYVNIDKNNLSEIIKKIKDVYESRNSKFIRQYKNVQNDNMHVIIQEMITADISGVMLTSNPFNGIDYLLIEYIKGDLCHLMQGDVSPLIAYINKIDIINNNEYNAYPAIITEELKRKFKILANIAIKLEKEFSNRVEIEWGVRNDDIYIFQVRPY